MCMLAQHFLISEVKHKAGRKLWIGKKTEIEILVILLN